MDTNNPQLITIESGVYITNGCVLLSHFFDVNKPTAHFNFGKIIIKKNAFLGCNTIICKPLTIGENAVIGAGSIVNKDVPSDEIWAGNPVRFIKKRKIQQN